MAGAEVRVMVVDDQPAFRRAAASVIEVTDGFTLVAELDDGAGAAALAERERADLVLIDVNMPGVGGVDAARQVGLARPGALVVLVSTYPPAEVPDDVARAPVPYLHKARLAPDVLHQLWEAHSGGPG